MTVSTFGETGAVEKYADGGHRLYRLADKDPYLSQRHEALPTPLWVHVARRLRAKPASFVWATKEQVEQIEKLRNESDATLPPLAVKAPADVSEFTAAKGKGGELYVLFSPNSQNDEDANSGSCRLHRAESQVAPGTPDYTYESINQIVAKWNEELKGQGVSVVAVEGTKPPKGVGFATLNMAGQIKIEFNDKLSEEAMKTIKSHPQAVGISHGAPFTSMYCPGCGMG